MDAIHLRNKERGFTLIELLVVIAIIGLLSSVVLSSLNSARTKSRDARRLSDIRQIQTALELYFDDVSPPEYPDQDSTRDVPLVLKTGGYLPSLPTDPRTGDSYYYDNLTNADASCSVATGVCTNYVLGANLEGTGHSALSGDINGTVASVNCADPVYCVQP